MDPEGVLNFYIGSWDVAVDEKLWSSSRIHMHGHGRRRMLETKCLGSSIGSILASKASSGAGGARSHAWRSRTHMAHMIWARDVSASSLPLLDGEWRWTDGDACVHACFQDPPHPSPLPVWPHSRRLIVYAFFVAWGVNLCKLYAERRKLLDSPPSCIFF
jgi:hypothetical protein